MFVLFLAIALIAGAVLLARNAHERVEGLVLVDDATGAAALEGWDILLQHSVIVGILAAVGLSASELNIRLVLRRRCEWLDQHYRDDQLGVARNDCRRIRRQLEDARRQLLAVKGQRGEFRRRLRQATRERDRAVKAAARTSSSPDPPGAAPANGSQPRP